MNPAPPPLQSPPAGLSKFQTFLRRLLSTTLLWGIVLTAIFAPNPNVRENVLLLLLLALGHLGLVEFHRLLDQRRLPSFPNWTLLSSVLLLGATHLALRFHQPNPATSFLHPAFADIESVVLIFAFLGLYCRQFFSKRHQATPLVAMAVTTLAFVYVPWLLNFLQKIFYHPGVDGRFYLLYFLVVTKFSDLGAYCTGSLVGRHKMIPRISPGKTWEGFAGALLVATGASVLFAHLAGPHLAGMTLVHAVVLGALLAVSAVVGDLIESLFKRDAGVKDSGRLFPGIGGILDLLDSLLFNAPILYLYMRWVLPA